jgi:8-oxo-dGTP pyrophosphatase MutT (NUDIX family)
MMQRYTVFLNDKKVIIHQDINNSTVKRGEMKIVYNDIESLSEAYKVFSQDPDCLILNVNTSGNFTLACENFDSLFTRIEAAGGIVRNQSGDMLFIKRSGIWDLPKGKLHKKEHIQNGALREVSEETGLTKLKIQKQLPSTFHIYTDRKGVEILKETFWFEMMSNKEQILVPQLDEDITEVRWFSANELKIPIQNTYASLRHLLDEYIHTAQ